MEAEIPRTPIGRCETDVAVTLTIVIASYNTRQLLLDCLASIS